MKRLLIALAATTAMAAAAHAEGELNIYNWVEYTSPEMIAKFEKETGIKTFAAEKPLDCVAVGTGKALENLDKLRPGTVFSNSVF